MKVWRVENAFGAGPYGFPSGPAVWAENPDDHENMRTHPTPSYDNMVDWEIHPDRDAYLFGFASLEDLRNWFSDTDLDRLYDLGFSIVQRETSDVLYGGHQVAFIPKYQ